jgi:hypothetical protein
LRHSSGNRLEEVRKIQSALAKGNGYPNLGSNRVTFWIQVRSCTVWANLFCLKLYKLVIN